MPSSAVLSLLVFSIEESQLELVQVWRDTSRHPHRRHPSRRGLALRLNVFFFSLENQEHKARASRSHASLLNTVTIYGTEWYASSRAPPPPRAINRLWFAWSIERYMYTGKHVFC